MESQQCECSFLVRWSFFSYSESFSISSLPYIGVLYENRRLLFSPCQAIALLRYSRARYQHRLLDVSLSRLPMTRRYTTFFVLRSTPEPRHVTFRKLSESIAILYFYNVKYEKPVFSVQDSWTLVSKNVACFS